jgi:hypothetical protein
MTGVEQSLEGVVYWGEFEHAINGVVSSYLLDEGFYEYNKETKSVSISLKDFFADRRLIFEFILVDEDGAKLGEFYSLFFANDNRVILILFDSFRSLAARDTPRQVRF